MIGPILFSSPVHGGGEPAQPVEGAAPRSVPAARPLHPLKQGRKRK